MDTLAAENSVLNVLRNHPLGVSEYDLLKQLEQHDVNIPTEVGDNLALFQSHFFLQHLLYKLRDRLWQQQQGHLFISALKIQILPYTESEDGVQLHDSLRDYYLDLNNLETTDEKDVEEMLNQFWQRFAAADDKTQALQLFSLKEPVQFHDIKSRYRQLVSQHHPDRGGDKDKLQQINDAMSTLKRYYHP